MYLHQPVDLPRTRYTDADNSYLASTVKIPTKKKKKEKEDTRYMKTKKNTHTHNKRNPGINTTCLTKMKHDATKQKRRRKAKSSQAKQNKR